VNRMTKRYAYLKTLAVVALQVALWGLGMGTPVFGLNQIQNWQFTSNDFGWTLDNLVARGQGMSTWSWTGADGNPAGSFYANAVGTANNQARDGLIEQTFTVTGGPANGWGRFSHKDTWVGAYDNFRLYCRLHTQDATPANPNDSVVLSVFTETNTNGAALHGTWQDTGWVGPIALASGTTYVWRVYWDMQCDNGEQAGAYVDNLKFIISPIGLRATPSGASVQLTWQASTGASTLAHYRVYRATVSGGPYTQIATVTTNSFLDTTPPGGTAYYVVTDVDTDGDESPYSVEAMAFTIAVRDGPTRDIEWSLFTDRLEANWDHPSAPLAGYRVAAGTTPGGTNVVNWTDVGMANRVTLTGLTLASGTRYYITVQALDAFGVVQSSGGSNGCVVRTDRVLVDTASSTFFNNGRAMYMIDTTTDPGSIRPRTLRSCNATAAQRSSAAWSRRLSTSTSTVSHGSCRRAACAPGHRAASARACFRIVATRRSS
jgi:hypothetical protein